MTVSMDATRELGKILADPRLRARLLRTGLQNDRPVIAVDWDDSAAEMMVQVDKSPAESALVIVLREGKVQCTAVFELEPERVPLVENATVDYGKVGTFFQADMMVRNRAFQPRHIPGLAKTLSSVNDFALAS